MYNSMSCKVLIMELCHILLILFYWNIFITEKRLRLNSFWGMGHAGKALFHTCYFMF